MNSRVLSLIERHASLESRLADVRQRLSSLNKRWNVPTLEVSNSMKNAAPIEEEEIDTYPMRDQPQSPDDIRADLANVDSETQQRLRSEILRLGIQRTRFIRTPLDYYDWSLDSRRRFLKAPSKSYLCKSMLMVNKKCVHPDCSQRTNAKYYLVVFQYEARFNNDMMCKFVRHELNGSKLGKNKFNFRLASSEDNARLSGYEHNAVTPIGFKSGDVPIIIDQRIVDSIDWIWLGGGEVDVKWAVSVRDFIDHFNAFVGPITSDPQ